MNFIDEIAQAVQDQRKEWDAQEEPNKIDLCILEDFHQLWESTDWMTMLRTIAAKADVDWQAVDIGIDRCRYKGWLVL